MEAIALSTTQQAIKLSTPIHPRVNDPRPTFGMTHDSPCCPITIASVVERREPRRTASQTDISHLTWPGYAAGHLNEHCTYLARFAQGSVRGPGRQHLSQIHRLLCAPSWMKSSTLERTDRCAERRMAKSRGQHLMATNLCTVRPTALGILWATDGARMA